MHLLDTEECSGCYVGLFVQKLGPCGHIWWDVLLTLCGGRPHTFSKISHHTLDNKNMPGSTAVRHERAEIITFF